MNEPTMINIPTNQNVMRFEITLNDDKVLRVQVERQISPCFKYGNQTQVSVEVLNGEYFEIFDTRYDKEMNTVEGYRAFFTDWVKNNWKNAKEIKQIA